MDFWNEILGECYALLSDCSLCLIIKSQVHQLDRHLNVHTCHAVYVHLEFSYLAWIRQRRLALLIQLMAYEHLVQNHISFMADDNIFQHFCNDVWNLQNL